MINRRQLKLNARKNLAGKYGDALGVVVLATLIAASLSVVFSLLSSVLFPMSRFTYFDGYFDQTGGLIDTQKALENALSIISNISQQILLVAVGVILIMSLTPLFKILVGNVIAVGRERWFIRAAHSGESPRISLMVSLFKGGEYKQTVLGMLWQSFWLFLWSIPPVLVLLFGFLPQQLLIFKAWSGKMAITEGLKLRVAREFGLPSFLFGWQMVPIVLVVFFIFLIVQIRKRYSYRLVSYVLADNPALGARRALNLSKEMTRGKIGGLFLLDLSFIGWILLCMMCICLPWITLHLLAPYYRMTWAEAYKAVRDQAVARGVIRMEDLGYVRVA